MRAKQKEIGMQHPITHCEPMPCMGYLQSHAEEGRETIVGTLELLSGDYPLLKTNRPMKIFPMTNKEFSEMVNGGYA